MVSNITDQIIPEIKEWQERPLDDAYPFVFIDAVHFSVREDNHIVKKAAYIVLGINSEGFKEVLGIWIGENESAKYWVGVLNELKQRGIKDILIICSDNLTGIKDVINAAFPNTVQQRCIVHMIRNSVKFVNYKDLKPFTNDLKKIYTSVDEEKGYQQFKENKQSEEGKELYDARKEHVELSFVDSKQNHRYRYAMYKGVLKNQHYTWLICVTKNMKNIAIKNDNVGKKPLTLSNIAHFLIKLFKKIKFSF